MSKWSGRAVRAMAGRRDDKFVDLFADVLGGGRLRLLDVGAAEQIQPRWRRVSRCLDYIGVEPDARSRMELLADQQGTATYSILETALNDGRSSHIYLNLCHKATVSSSLAPDTQWLQRFPDPDRFDIVETVEIRAASLDSLSVPNVDFMKLDVQGGELSILRGGTEVLSNCAGVEVEVEFAPIYKDQPLFGEVCEYLTGCGLPFLDFVSINRWGRQRFDGYGQAVFGDALFMRTPEDFIASGPTGEQRARYVAVCVLYGRFDLVEKLGELYGPALNDERSAIAVGRLQRRFEGARKLTSIGQRLLAHRVGPDVGLHLFY